MSAVEEYIARLVEAAPPLSAEQRDQLAGRLRPVRVVDAAACLESRSDYGGAAA